MTLNKIKFMKKIHEGGNAMKNLGLLSLALMGILSFLSGTIYALQGNPLWFSRIGLGSIIIGLCLIANKD